MNDSIEKKASLIIMYEILFALLPIIVIFCILIVTTNDVTSIFKKNDISFISVFFYGQTLVRLISGVTKSNKKKNWQMITLFVSIIIIFGLIPAVIWLCILYLEKYNNNIIFILQNIWFVMSIITYFVIGKIGQMYLNEDD